MVDSLIQNNKELEAVITALQTRLDFLRDCGLDPLISVANRRITNQVSDNDVTVAIEEVCTNLDEMINVACVLERIKGKSI